MIILIYLLIILKYLLIILIYLLFIYYLFYQYHGTLMAVIGALFKY